MSISQKGKSWLTTKFSSIERSIRNSGIIAKRRWCALHILSAVERIALHSKLRLCKRLQKINTAKWTNQTPKNSIYQKFFSIEQKKSESIMYILNIIERNIRKSENQKASKQASKQNGKLLMTYCLLFGGCFASKPFSFTKKDLFIYRYFPLSSFSLSVINLLKWVCSIINRNRQLSPTIRRRQRRKTNLRRLRLRALVFLINGVNHWSSVNKKSKLFVSNFRIKFR